MRKTILIAVALTMTGATAAVAQARPQLRAGPATWFTAYGLMYTSIARFHDPTTESDWVFDDNAFGAGLNIARELSAGLILGVDASFARPAYERHQRGGSAIAGAAGTATIATAMATGRIGYGGGGDLGFYLTGGIGTIAYSLEDLDGWNTDFALRAGTGLDYRMGSARAIFLEWGRIWGYHEREGVGGGAAQHGVLKLGLRFGR
jgi:opacity protein-like surface antigen